MSRRPALVPVTQHSTTAASLVILGGSRYDRAKSILDEALTKGSVRLLWWGIYFCRSSALEALSLS